MQAFADTPVVDDQTMKTNLLEKMEKKMTKNNQNDKNGKENDKTMTTNIC